MKERPIIFSAAMVAAILDERKSQTRRVIKPQPLESYGEDFDADGKSKARRSYGWSWQRPPSLHFVDCPSDEMIAACPYGVVGDRLWVKESWRKLLCDHSGECESYRGCRDKVEYRADAQPVVASHINWRSPRFMPRWASRATLEITEVRVQRLQEISEDDVRAEGCEYLAYRCAREMKPDDMTEFSDFWDSINGKFPGCSWADNPWVWAISFKVVE